MNILQTKIKKEINKFRCSYKLEDEEGTISFYYTNNNYSRTY